MRCERSTIEVPHTTDDGLECYDDQRVDRQNTTRRLIRRRKRKQRTRGM